MKTLFLVRHAKAGHDAPALSDRERPLNERGRHDAPMMGKRLAKHDSRPELLVSSPALRALTTAQLIADELGYRRERIVVDDRLYGSSPERVLDLVRALDDKVERAMLFGHNPEFGELAHRLSDQITEMPTCAVAEFGFDTKKWADVGNDPPVEVKLDSPKK